MEAGVPQGNPVLALRGVSKVFQRGEERIEALRDISLEVQHGEFVGIRGPSGCGKSTLLNILGCCESVSSGQMLLCGGDLTQASRETLTRVRRHRIGFVFQYFHLLETLTARENILLTLLLNHQSGDEAEARVAALLGRVGLEHRAAHYPQQLSGGEMQRVALCRALAHRPEVIVADEPTGNLDSHAGSQVIELLAECVSEGAAVVMASHSSEALGRCSRIISLRDGSRVE